MGEPGIGMQHNKEGFNIRASHQTCIPSNRPVSGGGGGNTSAVSVATNFTPYYLDKKHRREDTPVLCRGRFSKTTMEAGEPLQRDDLF